METFYIKKIQEVKKNLKEIQDKLNIKISILKNHVTIEGKAIDEYGASHVFEAIAFGFSAKKALLLTNEDYLFRIVKIKDHTKRNLVDIKSRLIGKKGKTRRVFADTSDCDIIISESEVGIIGLSEDVQHVETAIISLIKGSKETNMYKYLEKQNKLKKENTSFIDLQSRSVKKDQKN